MSKDMKIALPGYKVICSVIFMVLLPLVRGISQISDIGIAIVPNVVLLVIIFCADTYEIEFREKRWEVFTLMPKRNRIRAVRRRILTELVYLLLLSLAGYGLFYWQRPADLGEVSAFQLYAMFAAAAAAVIAFWGMLSLTLVNLTGKLWAGIGSAVVLWLLVNSRAGDEMLGDWNVLAFSFRDIKNAGDFGWMAGTAAAMLLAALMFAIVPHFLKRKGD